MNSIVLDPDAAGYLRQNALELAQLAALSYNTSDAIESTLGDGGLNRSFTFIGGAATDTQGFVAGNAATILVVFRGTQVAHLPDWLTELQAARMDHVLAGFHATVGEIWPHLVSAIATARGPGKSLLDLARSADPGHSPAPALWIAEHSLGGALAALLVADRLVKAQQPVAGLYTFGQPRVGGQDWSTTCNATFGPRYFRLVIDADIVPRVPTRAMAYADGGTRRYFDASGHMRQDESLWNRLLDQFRGQAGGSGTSGAGRPPGSCHQRVCGEA